MSLWKSLHMLPQGSEKRAKKIVLSLCLPNYRMSKKKKKKPQHVLYPKSRDEFVILRGGRGSLKFDLIRSLNTLDLRNFRTQYTYVLKLVIILFIDFSNSPSQMEIRSKPPPVVQFTQDRLTLIEEHCTRAIRVWSQHDDSSCSATIVIVNQPKGFLTSSELIRINPMMAVFRRPYNWTVSVRKGTIKKKKNHKRSEQGLKLCAVAKHCTQQQIKKCAVLSCFIRTHQQILESEGGDRPQIHLPVYCSKICEYLALNVRKTF